MWKTFRCDLSLQAFRRPVEQKSQLKHWLWQVYWFCFYGFDDVHTVRDTVQHFSTHMLLLQFQSFSSQEPMLAKLNEGQAMHWSNEQNQLVISHYQDCTKENNRTSGTYVCSSQSLYAKPGFIDSSFEHISKQSGCRPGETSSENGSALHELMLCNSWNQHNL